MNVINKLNRIKFEKIELIFFCLLLLGNLVNIWSLDVYSTMDGPAHLYNASLLNYFRDSVFLKEYYSLNEFYLPNFLPHLILQYFLKIMSPFVAEKLFLSIIVIALPLSFRYAVKLYSSSKNNFSFLIFSLVFSTLFISGFFNFSFAFIFFNFQLILLHYFFSGAKTTWVSFLSLVNSVALFYTHPFVYGLSLAVVFLLVFIHYLSDLKKVLTSSLFFGLIFMPTIVLFLFFYTQIHIPSHGLSSDSDLSPNEKFFNLFSFSPTIAFSYSDESVYAYTISGTLCFLLLVALINRFRLRDRNNLAKSSDAFFVLSVILIPFIFFIHNGSFGGLFTSRLTFMFFYLLIFWICSNAINSKIIIILSMLLIGFTYINLSLIRNKFIKQSSLAAVEVYQVSTQIRDKSIVYVEKYDVSYCLFHLSNYVGINKEVVITDNYEAVLKWFPLKWNDNIYKVKLSVDKNDTSCVLPDYVLIYGDHSQLNLPENEQLKTFIKKRAFMCYQSTTGYCRLYRVLK